MRLRRASKRAGRSYRATASTPRCPRHSTAPANASPPRAIFRRRSRARRSTPPITPAALASTPRWKPPPRPRISTTGGSTCGCRRKRPGRRARRRRRCWGSTPDAVTLHATIAGGAFGERLETLVAEQAALLAREVGASGATDLVAQRGHAARPLPPAARARMTARLGANGQILGWLTKIAAPSTGRELAERLLGNDWRVGAALRMPGKRRSLCGRRARCRLIACPPLRSIITRPTSACRPAIGAPARISTMCSFANVSSTNWRTPPIRRRCRSASACSAASRGSRAACRPQRRWAAGKAASPAAGRASPAMPSAAAGSRCWRRRISTTAARRWSTGWSRRSIAGASINPDVVRQNIEGGLILGLSAALGGSTGITENMPDARRLSALGLPRLVRYARHHRRADLERGRARRRVANLAVPPVAPAIANALQAATGVAHPPPAADGGRRMTPPPDHPPITAAQGRRAAGQSRHARRPDVAVGPPLSRRISVRSPRRRTAADGCGSRCCAASC